MKYSIFLISSFLHPSAVSQSKPTPILHWSLPSITSSYLALSTEWLLDAVIWISAAFSKKYFSFWYLPANPVIPHTDLNINLHLAKPLTLPAPFYLNGSPFKLFKLCSPVVTGHCNLIHSFCGTPFNVLSYKCLHYGDEHEKLVFSIPMQHCSRMPFRSKLSFCLVANKYSLNCLIGLHYCAYEWCLHSSGMIWTPNKLWWVNIRMACDLIWLLLQAVAVG